jgi:hypothetical protein
MGGFAVLIAGLFARNQKPAVASGDSTPIAGLQTTRKNSNKIFNNAEEVAPIVLSTKGKKDWVHWGASDAKSLHRKAQDTQLISNYSLLKPNIGILSAGKRGPSRGFMWNDGKPTANMLTYGGIHVSNGNGFQITVPAITEPQTLYVYVGGYKAGPEFTAMVSDGSTPIVKHTDLALGNGYFCREYVVKFQASSAKHKLTVQWTMRDEKQQGGNISLQAAALE